MKWQMSKHIQIIFYVFESWVIHARYMLILNVNMIWMHKKSLIYRIKEPHNEPHEDINLSPTFFPLSLFPTLPLPLSPSLSHHISILSLSRLAVVMKRPGDTKSISGLVVEYIVAIDVTRVWFPADASCQAEPPCCHIRGFKPPQVLLVTAFKTWTRWGLNPGPPACWAGVIPLHHVPSAKMRCASYLSK